MISRDKKAFSLGKHGDKWHEYRISHCYRLMQICMNESSSSFVSPVHNAQMHRFRFIILWYAIYFTLPSVSALWIEDAFAMNAFYYTNIINFSCQRVCFWCWCCCWSCIFRHFSWSRFVPYFYCSHKCAFLFLLFLLSYLALFIERQTKNRRNLDRAKCNKNREKKENIVY